MKKYKNIGSHQKSTKLLQDLLKVIDDLNKIRENDFE